MAKLKVTLVDGTVHDLAVTPKLEWAFEIYAKKGFHKAFIEDQKQSDVYWLAWEGLRQNGETVKPFGEQFLETLKKVEIVDADTPNG
jgi:hypothetical protein